MDSINSGRARPVDPQLGSVLAVLLLGSAPFLSAQGPCGPPPPPPPPAEPVCANADPLRQPFFGDLHVHTTYSLDADLHGTRLGPTDAYAFAQGSTLEIQPYDAQGNGLRTLTIDRPLDFAMVADHAEFFGEVSICKTPALPGYDSANCQAYRQAFPVGAAQHPAFIPFNFSLSTGTRFTDVCGAGGQDCLDEAATFWSDTQASAEAAYDRTSTCSFTTFIGYEWTRSPVGQNLHRNVVFKNTQVPALPTSFFEAGTKEQLWDALEADCTGDCDFLTIPHNSNLSNGLFFDATGMTQADAQRRQDMEPLIEVMQHKGQSECTPQSSADEFCDFEVLPYSTLAGPVLGINATPDPKDFVRSALKEGLKIKQSTGANPFKYGMIGSTDTHLAAPGSVSEDGYPGHGGAGVPAAAEIPPGLPDVPSFNPGGLVVLWAEQNSRDSLFSAMKRREAYATSGTRPVVRFFAGVGLDTSACYNPALGYAGGVPMGSDLVLPSPYNPATDTPVFVVSALKDPQGSDLARIQLIKGWVDSAGVTYEEIIHESGTAGGSVDPNTCQTTGSGSVQHCMAVYDAEFDPSQHAFYYARVLEDPTCRWHKRQCNAAGVACGVPATVTEGFEACCDGSLPDTIQERAWSSPIWYAPAQ